MSGKSGRPRDESEKWLRKLLRGGACGRAAASNERSGCCRARWDRRFAHARHVPYLRNASHTHSSQPERLDLRQLQRDCRSHWQKLDGSETRATEWFEALMFAYAVDRSTV